MNVIDYFDRVRIVNLESRVDRKREIEGEFRRHGFDINSDKVSFFKAIAPDDAGEFPTRGTKGCFLSHLEILQDALDSGVSNLLILEDDIAFIGAIKEVGAVAVKSLPEIDWDIAYLGHLNEGEELRWEITDKPLMTTHMYAINARVLPLFIRYLQDVLKRPAGHPDGGPMHYDGAINMFRAKHPEVKVAVFLKSMAYQRPSATDIHDKAAFHGLWGVRHFWGVFRKLKAAILRLTK